MLTLENISKAFGRVQALNNISLVIAPGCVQGILGENGAGKTTLMNILFGLIRPDRGQIRLSGQVIAVRSPRVAQKMGIGMVHQHFKLAPALSVTENLALAVGRNFGLLHRAYFRQRITEMARRLHWAVDPDSVVGHLNVGQQQRVEIIKALLGGGKILILDEPTAVLTPQEVDELIPAVRSLARAGITVIFISHKLSEVTRMCDRIAVLRRGEMVFAGPTNELSAEEITQRMLGTQSALPMMGASSAAPGPIRLQLSRVCCPVPGTHGVKPLLDNINLSVCAGEIVGIAGVEGNGQTSLIDAILGSLMIRSGVIALNGQDMRHLADFRRARQFACIPEDRQSQGLVLSLSLTANLMLRSYRNPEFSRFGLRRLTAWRAQAAALIRSFDIRCAGVDVPIQSLSGGNQQKALIARELHGNPPVILAINPTRGLDVGATAFVLQQLAAARQRGAAILLIHSDLDELLSLSDRVMVMYAGQLLPTNWPAVDRAAIGRMMMGVSPQAA